MKLTIFTPTYNRATTLCRIFNALCEQTDKRFEWLIIDDGSTDNTQELVRNLVYQSKDFEIRYYVQPHGGKHRAMNKAVDLAKGDLFITCDSNKYPATNAVELILNAAEKIKNIPMMCGIGGYRSDFNGNIWGGKILIGKEGYLDCTILEHDKYHIKGDKSQAFFTNILRKYKSPEYPNENFISEAVWLLPMAMDGYKTRWISEIFIYGEYSKDGLTKTGANERIGHENNFYGFLHTVKLEKEVKGLSVCSYLLFEALDIAKSKNMSDIVFMKKIGISRCELNYLRFNRFCHRQYNKLSQKIKKYLGEQKTEVVRKVIKKIKRGDF